ASTRSSTSTAARPRTRAAPASSAAAWAPRRAGYRTTPTAARSSSSWRRSAKRSRPPSASMAAIPPTRPCTRWRDERRSPTGSPGARSRPTSLVGGELEYLPQKCETLQEPGDVFEHTWSGGGGFGDPIDREPERVAEDVRNDAVSTAAARDIYGVVLDASGGVDTDATERRREAIRAERLS